MHVRMAARVREVRRRPWRLAAWGAGLVGLAAILVWALCFSPLLAVREVTVDGVPRTVGGRDFTLRLEPGCGARMTLAMTRYVNRPTLAFPWNR